MNVAAGSRNRATSDMYFSPITPKGWTFAVWGLIFFLQAIGVVWAAIPYGYGRDGGLKERVVSALALPWPLAWLFQCLWQFSFLARSKAGSAFFFFLLFERGGQQHARRGDHPPHLPLPSLTPPISLSFSLSRSPKS